MLIHNLTKNVPLASHAVLAKSFFSRLKGLLGRASLPPGEALIIVPSPSVHMFFMRFAIDVIFIDQYKRVIGLCPDLRPFQCSPVFWNSSCAIELPVGTIKQTQTELGDIVEIS